MKPFYQKVDKFNLSKIISIDETSIHAEMTASYSRCDLGKRCVKKTFNNKVFRKFTLVCAISKKRIVGWELYEKGGMTYDRMVNFINKYIKGKYKNNLIIINKYFFMTIKKYLFYRHKKITSCRARTCASEESGS